MFCDVMGHFADKGVAKQRHCRNAGVLAMFGVLAGCAGMGGLSADSSADAKRDVVSTRAKARWDALIKEDVAQAYTYLSPASRATLPLEAYRAKQRVGLYKAAKVDDVKCEADVCTVSLSITYDYKQFKGVTTPLVEKWVIAQGQAWFVDPVSARPL